MKRDPLIVAVIPAHNEEKNIAGVIEKTRIYVDKIIVCDDGSEDKTGEIAKASGAIVLTHKQNRGYGAALSTLFREARKLKPDVMVTLDADGQHDPEYIPELVSEILRNGTDVVIGSRFLRQRDRERVPAYRTFGISVITRLVKNASGPGITDAQSGFRAYGRNALQAIRPTGQGMGASTEILIKARQSGLTIREIPMTVIYEGKKAKGNPAARWIGVVLSTMRIASVRRPQIFYGMPSMMVLIVGLGFWIRASLMYRATGQIEVSMTFLALGATIVGLILLVLSIMLWKLIGVVKETWSPRERTP